jgi:YaiO family outer membrane protein
MKLAHASATLLVAFASSAHAAPLPNLKKIMASVDGEYLSYSGTFGSRRIVNAETRIDTGPTLVSLGIAQGSRKAGDDKFNATRLTAAVVHDWSSRLSTRTSASIASNQPVFVTRELIQEISYKPLPQTVLTVGGRYARYWGGVDALSWSLGAAQYFRGGMVSYRFSSFDVRNLGHSTGHLLSAKLEDPYGSNQVWLGHGTALHDAIWLATPEKGNYNNIEYRRVQPIGGGIGLMLGVNRIWYKADSAKFHGTGVRVGFVFSTEPGSPPVPKNR